MRQGDGDIDWYRAYRKLKMRFDETSKMLEEQSELNKKLREQLALCSVVVSEAELCQYDKMCVRRKINDGCPYDCKDDTRKKHN